MSKGIATETIIKIMLGLIVVAIILYLIYKFVLKSPIAPEECKARLTSWCTSCKISNFLAVLDMSSDLQDCVVKYTLSSVHHTCKDVNVPTECKPYLPVAQ
jgi:hypothetical protein